MAKYDSTATKEVEKEMRLFKEGAAKSGKSKEAVKSGKQAIAIGLSKARKKGAKVPTKKVSKAKKAKSATKKVTAKTKKSTKTAKKPLRKNPTVKATARKSTTKTKKSTAASKAKKSAKSLPAKS